jgi:sugar lactone lactonase YvrE
MTSPTLRRAAALAGSLALLALLPAGASAAGNPQVVRVDPTTGVVKQLAGGAPFTHLGGLAFGPTGTLYVANQGPVGPSPRGAGIYALRAPTYAAASIASGTTPTAVVASGGTLYSIDGDRIVGIDGTTGAERTVTAGGLYDAYGVYPTFGAVSGSTLYTTASSSCDSVGGSGAYVIAVDTTTGAQTLVKAFGCHALGGIATTPGGMLTVAVGGRPAKIVQLDPQSGALTTLSSGGSLKTPQGLALDAAGDVLVADSTSGVIAVSGEGGQQSPYTSPGALGGATGIAVGPDGALYVSEAGVPPKLVATAARRQRLTASGLALTVRCNRACTVGYSAKVSGFTVSGFQKSAAFRGVQGRRSVRITLPRQVRREIATALRHGKKVTAKVALTPRDPRSGSLGKRTTLPIRIL